MSKQAKPASTKSSKTKNDRLAKALRDNLRRRKVHAKKTAIPSENNTK